MADPTPPINVPRRARRVAGPIETAIASRAGGGPSLEERIAAITAEAEKDISGLASPQLDINELVKRLAPAPRDAGGFRGAIGRALEAAGTAAGAVGPEAGEFAGLGGAVGALRGFGITARRERAERARLDSPRQKLLQAITEAQATEAIKEPGRVTAKKRQLRKETASKRIGGEIASERLKQTALIAARNAGVSDSVGRTAAARAERDITLRGIPFGTPEFSAAVLQRTSEIIQEMKRLGLKGAQAAPPSRPARPAAPTGDRLDNILFPK